MSHENCICGKESISYCGGCKGKRYCSVECQKSDWPKHKSECKDFKLSKEDYDFYFAKGASLDYILNEKSFESETEKDNALNKQRIKAIKKGIVIKQEKIKYLKSFVLKFVKKYPMKNGNIGYVMTYPTEKIFNIGIDEKDKCECGADTCRNPLTYSILVYKSDDNIYALFSQNKFGIHHRSNAKEIKNGVVLTKHDLVQGVHDCEHCTLETSHCIPTIYHYCRYENGEILAKFKANKKKHLIKYSSNRF